MKERDRQFLESYKIYRLQDQEEYYEERIKEYQAARNQIINVTGFCMFLAAVFSLLSTLNHGPLSIEMVKKIFGGLAVVIPAFSSAVAAYNTLYAFEKQSKLYEDALTALKRAYAESPIHLKDLSPADFHQRLRHYIRETESVMRSEIGQWGQLISEVKPVQPEEIPRPATVPPSDEQEKREN